MFEWSINFGNLLTMIGAVSTMLGGLWILHINQRTSNALMAKSLEVLSGRTLNVEIELRGLREIITALAVMDKRIEIIEDRQNQQADRINKIAQSSDDWRRIVFQRIIGEPGLPPKFDPAGT